MDKQNYVISAATHLHIQPTYSIVLTAAWKHAVTSSVNGQNYVLYQLG